MDYVESNISQGRDSHSGVIRCLAFNKTGSLIASGGDDMTVKIWEVKGGKLRFHIEGHAPVLSLAWTLDPHILVVGFEDNLIATIVITEELLEVYGIYLPETQRKRGYPIECLALNTASASSTGCEIKLAAGGHQWVQIWNFIEGTSYQWGRGRRLPQPFSNGTNDDLKILVTGVDWIDSQKVLVSYMFHGLMCWDTEECATLFTIPIPSSIGRMALSPDRLTVAVYNMYSGVDIWDIGKAERRQSCKVARAGRNFPLPVTFLHNGTAVAAGNMEGRVGLWDVKDGSLIEELDHAGEPVHAISFFHYHDLEDGRIRSMIVTASVQALNQHRIRFWEASSQSAQWTLLCSSGCSSFVGPISTEELDGTQAPPCMATRQSNIRCTNCLLTSAGIVGIVLAAGFLGTR